jgi:hypothetical protein
VTLDIVLQTTHSAWVVYDERPVRGNHVGVSLLVGSDSEIAPTKEWMHHVWRKRGRGTLCRSASNTQIHKSKERSSSLTHAACREFAQNV